MTVVRAAAEMGLPVRYIDSWAQPEARAAPEGAVGVARPPQGADRSRTRGRPGPSRTRLPVVWGEERGSRDQGMAAASSCRGRKGIITLVEDKAGDGIREGGKPRGWGGGGGGFSVPRWRRCPIQGPR